MSKFFCFISVFATCVVMSSMLCAAGLEGDAIKTDDGDLIIHPINHATLEMSLDGKVIAVDPVGGPEVFAKLPKPDLILVTDIHGDHFNVPTLTALARKGTVLVAPAVVVEKLPQELGATIVPLANGQTTTQMEITIEAIPMYNLTPERAQFHTKGRGNGYVLTLGGKRVYLSGDTEDIPEMRALKNIDVAFVCMNLPYTMDVEHAADAVLEFKPAVVYPYHYRGKTGMSDVNHFKELVNAKDDKIDVRLRDWYAK
ncbi:MAG: MBL fold metallo-hydrolase [Planctomycetes bacterium]|nr:MBL fold metallo-hydrolase [Planctomycetota bacterium]